MTSASTRPQRASAQSVAAADITAPGSAERAERAKHLPLDERARERILSRIALNARRACGMTQRELAAAMGLTRPQLINEWEDPSKPAVPRTDHLLRAPVQYRRYWARELAAFDGDVIDRRLRVVHATLAQRTAALVKELGETSIGHATDAADGCIDDPAARLQELHEAREALDEYEAALRDVIEQRRAR